MRLVSRVTSRQPEKQLFQHGCLSLSLSLSLSLCIYIYTYVCTYIYIYIYIISVKQNTWLQQNARTLRLRQMSAHSAGRKSTFMYNTLRYGLRMLQMILMLLPVIIIITISLLLLLIIKTIICLT